MHGHWDDWASALAFQADGRIVVAGGANLGRSKMNVALARHLAAAVGSPPAVSAVASSPSPGHTATASSLSDGTWKKSRDENGTLGVHSADVGRPHYIHVKKGQYLKLRTAKMRRVK